MMNSKLQSTLQSPCRCDSQPGNWQRLTFFHSYKRLHKIIKNKLGLVAQAFNPQISEAETRARKLRQGGCSEV